MSCTPLLLVPHGPPGERSTRITRGSTRLPTLASCQRPPCASWSLSSSCRWSAVNPSCLTQGPRPEPSGVQQPRPLSGGYGSASNRRCGGVQTVSTPVRGLARRRALTLLACQLVPVAVFLGSGYVRPRPPAEAGAASSSYNLVMLFGGLLSIAVALGLYNALYELVRQTWGWPRWLYVVIGAGIFLTVQGVTGGLTDASSAWTGTVEPLLIAGLLDVAIYSVVTRGVSRTQTV